jgi:hypothetical protein
MRIGSSNLEDMMNSTVDVMDPSSYMKQRVDDQLKYYEKAANRAKKAYNVTQTAIIVLGLLVPVAVNVPVEWGNGTNPLDISLHIKVLVTVMSLSLAILNGIANFKKYGDLWLSYRMTEELLKHEKFMFQTRTGKYGNPDTAFSEFVQFIESILSAEHNKFRSLVEEARRPAGKTPQPAAAK